jgi:hypothetical protein
MTESQPPRRWARSIGALFVGFVVVLVLTLGTDMALHAAGIFPKLGDRMSDPLFVLATAYRTVYAIIGSFITARFAPDRPMQHALVGGCIGLVLSIVGAVVTWNKDLGPHWYPLALVVTALPCAWVGGWIRLRQLRTTNAGLPGNELGAMR